MGVPHWCLLPQQSVWDSPLLLPSPEIQHTLNPRQTEIPSGLGTLPFTNSGAGGEGRWGAWGIQEEAVLPCSLRSTQL